METNKKDQTWAHLVPADWQCLNCVLRCQIKVKMAFFKYLKNHYSWNIHVGEFVFAAINRKLFKVNFTFLKSYNWTYFTQLNCFFNKEITIFIQILATCCQFLGVFGSKWPLFSLWVSFTCLAPLGSANRTHKLPIWAP